MTAGRTASANTDEKVLSSKCEDATRDLSGIAPAQTSPRNLPSGNWRNVTGMHVRGMARFHALTTRLLATSACIKNTPGLRHSDTQENKSTTGVSLSCLNGRDWLRDKHRTLWALQLHQRIFPFSFAVSRQRRPAALARIHRLSRHFARGRACPRPGNKPARPSIR